MVEKPSKLSVHPPKEFLRLKIIMLGEGGVGKTAIASRFCEGSYPKAYTPTIAVDYKNRIIETKDHNININIWDFAGHPEFFEVRNEFYKDANLIMLVFDITLRRTLEGLDLWIKEASENGAVDVPFVLIGNKRDLAPKRAISEDEAKTWAKAKNCNYYEVSAETASFIKHQEFNIEDAFRDIVKTFL